MRKKLTRFLSLFLATVLTFTSVDLPAFAAETTETAENEALKEELRNMVSDEEHPNGVFGFADTMISLSEGEDGIITVTRAGNTDNPASVVFKAVDISSVYGQDYTLSVNKSIFGDSELKENPDTVPLMQAYGDVYSPEVAVDKEIDAGTAEEMLEGAVIAETDENNAGTDEEMPEGVAPGDANDVENDAASGNVTVAGVEETSETPDEDVTVTEVTGEGMDDEVPAGEGAADEDMGFHGRSNGLLNVYKAQTGETAPLYDWREYTEREVTEDEAENLATGNAKTRKDLEQLDGVTVTLTFKKGEYKKEVRVSAIDDKKSESEELFIFLLQDAENAEIGETYNGYVNIIDNDEKEEMTYSIRENKMTVSPDDPYVSVTVSRTSGIDRMDIVTVGTQAVDAVPDADYEVTRRELLFAPGETERTAEIRVYPGNSTEDRHFWIGLISDSGNVEDTGNACLVTIPGSEAAQETADSLPEEYLNAVEQLGDGKMDGARETVYYTADMFDLDNGTGSYVGSHGRYVTPYNSRMPFDLSGADYMWFDIEYWGHTSYGIFGKPDTKDMHLEILDANHKQMLSLKETYKGAPNFSDARHWRFFVDVNDLHGDLSSVYLHPWVYGVGTCLCNDVYCKIDSVVIGYNPFEIMINNANPNNKYTEMQYNGKDPSTAVDTGFDVRFPDVYLDDGTVKGSDRATYCSGDVIHVKQGDPRGTNSQGVSPTSDVVELKGFRVQKVGAGNPMSSEVIPIGFQVNKEFMRKYFTKDYLFNGIQTNKLIQLVPVYELKTAKVRFTNSFGKVTQADGSEEVRGGYVHYDDGTELTINKLDTIKVEAYANGTNAITRITLSGKKNENDMTMSSTGRDSSQNIAPAQPTTFVTHLGDRDLTYYQVGIEYDTTTLKVMPDPKFKNFEDIKKGAVTYTPKGEKTQTYNGGEAFSLSDVTINQTYNIAGLTNNKDDAGKDNYKVMWRDGTLDEDEDGEWVENDPGYKSFVPSSGSVLPYTTRRPTSRIYYSFVPRSNAQQPAPIVGWLMLEDKLLLSGMTKTKGLTGAQIWADNQTASTSYGTYKGTSGNGFYRLDSPSFSVLDNYLVNIGYDGPEGIINTGVTQIPGRAQNVVVSTYEELRIDNVKLFKKEKDGKDENGNPKEGEYKAETPTISNGYFVKWTNGNHNYRIQMTPSAEGVKITEGVLKFYKDDTCLTQNVKGTVNDASGEFTFDFNPDTLGLEAGTVLAVAFTDNKGRTYLQREVGIEFRQTMGVVQVVNSFLGGKQTGVDLIGNVDMLFNLGWGGEFDDVEINDSGEKVISIGYNFDAISTQKKKKPLDDAAKKLADEIQNKADKEKALQEVMDKYSGDKADSKEAEEEMQKAIKEVEDAEAARVKEEENFKSASKQAVTPEKKKVKMGGKAEMEVGFSFAMTFAYDNGDYYFKSLVLTAELEGEVSGSVQFATPIGVTVTITLALSGGAKASFIVQTRGDNDESKRYYVSKVGDEGINVWDFNPRDVNRKFDSYGAFILTPKITLDVKAGVLGDTVSVTLSGGAEFNLVFYANKEGDSGRVRLTADLSVHVLVFDFKKNFVKKDYNLFGDDTSNLGAAALGALEQENVLYESADGFEPEDVSYMAGGSTWYSEEEEEMLALGAGTSDPEKFTERVMANKIGSDPNFDMTYLGNGRYAGVFLNVPANRVDAGSDSKAAYYMYYDGSKWTEPEVLEEDSTLDGVPRIYSLGDRGAVIIWPSSNPDQGQYEDGNDEEIAKLNSLDLHARFIDPDGKLKGDVQEVTRTTHDEVDPKYGEFDWSDTAADVSPMVSYSDNRMIVYYQKQYYEASEYETSEDGTVKARALVGDVINPKFSLMAYRIYDFERNEWIEPEASEEDIAGIWADFASLPEEVRDERIQAYSRCYYGQRFCDPLPNVRVIEEIDETTGYRKAGTKPEYEDQGYIPVILDSSSCSLDAVGLYAFSVDTDGDLETVEDREIYLQVYDFESDEMTAVVILTADNVSDTDPDLVMLDDSIWLSWLKDGNIVTMDVSYLTYDWENSLEKVYEDCYVINKEEPADGTIGYIAPIEIVHGDRLETVEGADKKNESSITSFQSESNGDQIYYIWAKSGTNLKEGVEENTPEAEDPENLVLERHLYSARVQVVPSDVETSGKPISMISGITMPIQLTEENGMSYDYVSFDVDEEKNINGLAWKAPSMIKTEGGMSYPVVDVEDAVPVRFKTLNDGTPEIRDAGFSYASAGDTAVFAFDVLNDGYETLDGITVRATDAAGNPVLTSLDEETGEISTVESITMDGLTGGKAQTFTGQFALNEDAKDARAAITLTDAAGSILRVLDIREKLEPYVVLDSLEATETAQRGIYHVKGTLTNLGNAKTGENAEMILGYEMGTEFEALQNVGYGNDPILPGDSRVIETDLTIPDEYFTAATDGSGNVTETFRLMVETDRDTISDVTVERRASVDAVNTVTAITNMTVYGGEPLSFNANKVGEVITLDPQVESELARTETGYVVNKEGVLISSDNVMVTGAENLKYRYEVESSPEGAVSVDTLGNLTVQKSGSGFINVYAYYDEGDLQAYNSLSKDDVSISSDTADGYVTTATQGLKKYSFAFRVSSRTGDEKFISGGLAYYKIGDDKVTVAGLADGVSRTSISIPATVKFADDKTKYEVVAIELGAFAGNTDIRSVSVGKNVETIGAQAFMGCTSLKKVTLGASVTEILDSAFEGCAALTSVGLKDGLREIGNNAFRECVSLKTVTIPKNVDKIGDSAFFGCVLLGKVTVKSTLLMEAGIGNDPFEGIPEYCEFVLSGTGDQLAALQALTTWSGDRFYVRGVQYAVSTANAVRVVGVDNVDVTVAKGRVTIPARVKYLGMNYDVTRIDSGAFSGNEYITKVTIGKNVREIDSGAFEGCTALTSVKIPAGVTVIHDDTFMGCTSLKTVTIGKNVTVIDDRAFERCGALKSIKIPAKVTEIGTEAFAECTSLKKVTLGKGLRTIGESCFEDCVSLTSITIPANVTTICDYAFNGCKSLKTVTVKSANLASIGKAAFNMIDEKAVVKLSIGKDVKEKIRSLFTSKAGINVEEGMTIK